MGFEGNMGNNKKISKRQRLLFILDHLNYKIVFACLAAYLIFAAIIIGAFDKRSPKPQKQPVKTEEEPKATLSDAFTAFTTEQATTEAQGISKPTEGYDLSEDEKNTPNILLLQNDPRWKDAPYGSSGTVGQYGGGPTCLSMAVIYLTKDFTATPPRVAEYSANAGYYMDGEGTSYAIFTEGCANYGLKSEWLATDDEERLKAGLDQGEILIASILEKTLGYNPTDQYVVIYGYDDDGFLINDPANEKTSSKKYKFEDIENGMMAVFALSVDPSAKPSTDASKDKTTEASTETSEEATTEGAGE